MGGEQKVRTKGKIHLKPSFFLVFSMNKCAAPTSFFEELIKKQ
ncbi:hypothetical protein P872_17835 [Rhodonellum psychrophilum GCM71 = DSM 17998]|uniref:Uncharacterized protein n=1 Tax=Rhodonellum psychrophilum GCM71 = DSM 17998 TaxID=1123057 RepID=U5C0P0_9BACT|nr:hypothetical protein P872_17835 [Rhodonellum psychrophilum GCM71 = DSM 17998]